MHTYFRSWDIIIREGFTGPVTFAPPVTHNFRPRRRAELEVKSTRYLRLNMVRNALCASANCVNAFIWFSIIVYIMMRIGSDFLYVDGINLRVKANHALIANRGQKRFLQRPNITLNYLLFV